MKPIAKVAMPPDLTLHQLPPPATLAVPLVADAALRVAVGDKVCSGAVLAEGASGADILAPLGGEVSAVARRPLAQGGSALCVVLARLSADPPPPVKADSIPLLLKRAGIVGLGGGAFPAWRKWRRGLQWLVVNGLETEPAAHNDAALLAAAPDELIKSVEQVAQAFAAAPLLALPPDVAVAEHPCIRRLPPHYAIGNERLLVEELCGVTIPPDGIVADYGVVCFNIATVLAIAAALTDGTPLTQRVVTVHTEAGEARLLRLPFGASVGDVRRWLGASGAAVVGGGDDHRQVGDDAVLTAATTVMRFGAAAEAAALPCIRCGACEPVCPVALSPQRLYHLAQDSRWADMAAQRLSHCLECRRCDEVCPSRIPLTAAFISGKKEWAEQQAEQAEIHRRRERFDRHTERLTKPETRIDGSALSRHVQAAVDKSKQTMNR